MNEEEMIEEATQRALLNPILHVLEADVNYYYTEVLKEQGDVEILYERWKDGKLTDEEILSLIDMLDGERLSHMIRWIEDENSEGMSNLRIGIKERFGAEAEE